MKPRILDVSKMTETAKRMNPHLLECSKQAQGAPRSPNLSLSGEKGPSTAKRPSRGKKRLEMNATEREFNAYLEWLMMNEDILSFDYEGITLNWNADGCGMRYTPDFVAVKDIRTYPNGIKPFVQLVFYEIKGAHAWKQDIVKFKAARANWPMFEFQLWEKTKEGWHQTI